MVWKSKSPMSNNDKKEVIVKQQHIKHYSGMRLLKVMREIVQEQQTEY